MGFFREIFILFSLIKNYKKEIQNSVLSGQQPKTQWPGVKTMEKPTNLPPSRQRGPLGAQTAMNSPPHMRNNLLDVGKSQFGNNPMSGKTSANSKESSNNFSKSKPTGMSVQSMTINQKKILSKWKNILLKFHYVKKQFYIELESELPSSINDGKI